jgi:hypothetical protein
MQHVAGRTIPNSLTIDCRQHTYLKRNKYRSREKCCILGLASNIPTNHPTD